jgi:hypothetical protein
MYIQTEHSEEGSKFPSEDSFNHDLYYEVRNERKRLNIDNHSLNIVLEDYPLVGRKIKNNETGKIYNIEQANRHWHGGWYIGLLIEQNKSHAFIWFENIDCWNNIVVNSIEKNKTKYTLLEEN